MLSQTMPVRARLRRKRHVLRAELVATVRLIEAWFALIVARLGIVFLPHFADWALRPHHVQNNAPHDRSIPPYVLNRIRVAIQRAAHGLPWESRCLANAFAAKMMLARQGFDSTIHLGAGNREGQLHAHAWLVAAGTIVVGEDGIHTVTPLIK